MKFFEFCLGYYRWKNDQFLCPHFLQENSGCIGRKDICMGSYFGIGGPQNFTRFVFHFIFLSLNSNLKNFNYFFKVEVPLEAMEF